MASVYILDEINSKKEVRTFLVPEILEKKYTLEIEPLMSTNQVIL